ncbi:MAG: hypothetical protein QW063_02350 [Candidatus Nanoarchaeia archaeon]
MRYDIIEIETLKNKNSARALGEFLSSIKSSYSLFIWDAYSPNNVINNLEDALEFSVEGFVKGQNGWRGYFTKLPRRFFDDLKCITDLAEIFVEDIKHKLEEESQHKNPFFADILKKYVTKKELEGLEARIEKVLPVDKRKDAEELVNLKYLLHFEKTISILKQLYYGCCASAAGCYSEYVEIINKRPNDLPPFVGSLPRPILLAVGSDSNGSNYLVTYFDTNGPNGEIKKYTEDISHLPIDELLDMYLNE